MDIERYIYNNIYVIINKRKRREYNNKKKFIFHIHFNISGKDITHVKSDGLLFNTANETDLLISEYILL